MARRDSRGDSLGDRASLERVIADERFKGAAYERWYVKDFIGHSSADAAEALAIAKWLEDNGWSEYFLDLTAHQGLAPGEKWQAALQAAAGRCEAVLFLISPRWRDSKWCLAEFLLAKQLGKKVFGVLIKPTPLETLPGELTTEWQLCDLVSGERRRSITVSDDPIVPQATISFAEAGLSRLKIGLQKAGLDPSTFSWPPAHDPQRTPYRGLKPLEADDAAIFFGRDVLINRGLDALRSIQERGVERLFVMLAASGAGKSSYLRAGLWPRLARDDRRFLPLPVLRPQGAALTGPTGLIASFDEAFRTRGVVRNRADVRGVLRSPAGLLRLVSELQGLAQRSLEPDSPPPTALIAIDQGEELFISEGREESESLLGMLNEALTAPARRQPTPRPELVAILGIRSDAYDRLQTDPHLATVTQVAFPLTPIGRAEYKDIITGPAGRSTAAGRRLHLEPALTDRLLEDADGLDALPLLAFTLERLFLDYGGDGELGVADYDALGGVHGSIAAAIDTAFAHPARAPVIPDDRVVRERLLRAAFIPWLASIDPETDMPRRRIASWDEIPTDAHGVIERLVDARLLVRDRHSTPSGTTVVVEVAHEALLRQWPTLKGWLAEDTVALKVAEALGRAADEWLTNNRGTEWLVHTGERLETAETLRQRPDFERLMGESGRDYLAACRARDNQVRHQRETQLARIKAEQIASQRLRRRVTLVSIAAAIIFMVATAYTGQQWYKSNQAIKLIQKKLGRVEILADGPANIMWNIYRRPNGQEDESIDQWNVLTDRNASIASGMAGSRPIELAEGDYWVALFSRDGGRPQVIPIQGHGYNEYQIPLKISTAMFLSYDRIAKGMHLVQGDQHFILKPGDVYSTDREMSFDLKSFFVDDDVVTLEDFVTFVDATGWKVVKNDDLYLNWYDAHAYCMWRRKRLMTAVEAVQIGRVKPDIVRHFDSGFRKPSQNAQTAENPERGSDVTEFIWDFQGEWLHNDITGPQPNPAYKMKKNFDFAYLDHGLEVQFGFSKGFNPPITRMEGFRFRCALSDDDAEYARARK